MSTTTRPPKLPPAWFKHAFWRVHRALNRLSGADKLMTSVADYREATRAYPACRNNSQPA